MVGAPKKLEIKSTEIDPDSPLILGIPYPEGTQVTITATVQCNNKVPDEYTCSETYHEVNSPEAVHSSQGNTYHMDSNGFLTVCVIMLARKCIGTEDGFTIPTLDTPSYDGWYALDHFERDGIVLLRKSKKNCNPLLMLTVV